MTGEIRLVADIPVYLVEGYEDNEGLWHEDTGFLKPPVKEVPWFEDAGWLPGYVHEAVGDSFSAAQAALLAKEIERNFAAHPFEWDSDVPERVADTLSWLWYWADSEKIGVVIEPGDRDSDHTQ